MRQGQQIDGNGARLPLDARGCVYAAGDRGKYGPAGQVAGVDDAPLAVPALAGKFQTTSRLAVKGDVQFLQQQFPDRGGAFTHQLLHCRRIGAAITGGDDILRQQLGIGRGIVDDATLSPVAVGLRGSAQ